MITRAALALAAVAATLAAVPASAQPPARQLVLQDVAGDANGLNDQGSERVVGDIAIPGLSSPEADLLRVRLAPLKQSGRVIGWSLSFRLAGRVGPNSRTGQDLAYGLVAQASEACRFQVLYQTHGSRAGGASTTSSGGCGATETRAQPLAATVAGDLIRVDLPYAFLPDAVRRGVVLRDIQAFVRLVPGGTAPLGELDAVRADDQYQLP